MSVARPSFVRCVVLLGRSWIPCCGGVVRRLSVVVCHCAVSSLSLSLVRIVRFLLCGPVRCLVLGAVSVVSVVVAALPASVGVVIPLVRLSSLVSCAFGGFPCSVAWFRLGVPGSPPSSLSVYGTRWRVVLSSFEARSAS